MKKLFLCLLVILTVPFAAYAEIYTEEGEGWKAFTFAGEMLPEIQPVLTEEGYAECNFLTGASVQSKAYQGEPPEAFEVHAALIALNGPNGRRLLGISKTDHRGWRVEDFGANFLPDGSFAIGLHDQSNGKAPVFCLAYSGQRCYHFEYRYGRMWRITGYHDLSGIVIQTKTGEFVLNDNVGSTAFHALDGYWPEYMTSLNEYPTSRTEAENMEAAALDRLQKETEQGIFTIQNANLRTEPTASSESLGVVDAAAVVYDLGGRAAGSKRPWIQVQVGHVKGWVDSHYVSDGGLGVPDIPLRVGRILQNGYLRELPNGAFRTEIEKGTVFHVLASTPDDWLLISIPNGELGWEMDVNGQTGYLHESEAVIGPTLNAVR